ncbi:acriflavin resistance protein [Desulfovibrio sp. X2]|uniref:efflux RND transporter permease subunit n=1 Tax=Desulfovibrio sp. X2 TaxID=941449 RepID=UPI000358A160|nr:efflux RND transporter permease subunit [Desulfovibrio sp. X2]EPR38722.1 acriflavin resistance protein [Desulfovibrio sp. X2]
MNISEPFIRRPVMTTLVMAAMLLFGIVGYIQLPVSDLPNVDFPTILVRAELPGANPETMASSVAAPLEREFATISGIDSMSSVSGVGQTRITIQFNLDRNIDAAAQDVQSAIGKAQRKLPDDLSTPPSYQKVNPSDQPILYLTLASKTLPLSTVSEYADTFIGQRISMLPGVALVNIYGQRKYAVRVQLDPKALASRGLGIDEVAEAVSRGNTNLPVGALSGEHTAYNIKSSGKLQQAADFRPLIVSWQGGSPVRLEQLGRVLDGVENDRLALWRDNDQAVILAIQRQPGTNTVAVVDSIRKLLPTFRSQLPAGLELSVMYDRSESIRASVHDVKFTLVLTIFLVVAVIFLFLRNLRATLIPSLALPISIIATFAVMRRMNFSLDNLSLMAMTLAVGFVVDDAIVMLENIVRHREMGKNRFQAALDGSKEISFTIVSMTISLAAVFIPVMFMGGIVGRLFEEFGVVIMASVLLSGVVSLTLTPMLCSRFLDNTDHGAHGGEGEKAHGRFYQLSEKVFDSMLAFYRATLSVCMRWHFATFLVSLAVLGVTVAVFQHIPKGFLPSQDTGMLWGTTEAVQGISYDDMVRHQQALHKFLREDPGVESFMSVVGVGGPNLSLNNGRLTLKLKPLSERKESADQIMRRLRGKLNTVPGIQTFLRNPPLINIGGRTTKSLYQFTLQDPDTSELYSSAAKLEARLKTSQLLQDVNSDVQLSNPEVRINIRRDRAAALGISPHQIELALQSAFGTRQISTIYTDTNDYEVILELLPEYQRDTSALSLLYVRSSDGSLVPLDTLADITRGMGPLAVNHSGQLPSATISFNLRPGVALSQAVAEVNQAAKILPASISTGFEGTAQAFQASTKGLMLLLLLAVIVIYIVLGILYESFIHPLTILSGLPSAGFGALLTLWLFGKELDIYGFVGIIMLIGIVKKNAIMMIDFALEAQREQNMDPAKAIFEGCLVRFRPIMMTTMAALMGTLPIAIAYGAGGEARQPLGLAVVGGLVFSQLLTLYITPVYFIYLSKFTGWLSGLLHRKGGARAKPDPAEDTPA